MLTVLNYSFIQNLFALDCRRNQFVQLCVCVCLCALKTVFLSLFDTQTTTPCPEESGEIGGGGGFNFVFISSPTINKECVCVYPHIC